MSFVLIALGLLLLVIALAGIALGIYMAVDPRTRNSGVFFAILWVPVLAAASGVLMRDVVTFSVGMVCFAVAGAVLVLQDGRLRKAQDREEGNVARGPGGGRRLASEKTTRENRAKGSGRAAS
jgi:hypothetical protein